MADDLTHEHAAALDLDRRLRSVEARLEMLHRRQVDEILRLKMLLLDAQRKNGRSPRPVLVDGPAPPSR